MRFTMPIVFASAMLGAAASAQNCANTSVGLTPLNDLGPGLHLGEVGGLYPGGSNLRPLNHDLAGRNLASNIRPLNAQGQVDLASGVVVMASIGMSNTTQEFSTFIQATNGFANLHPRLRIVDTAQGGQAAQEVANPDDDYWMFVDNRIAQAGFTNAQVQVVWMKTAMSGPGNLFPPGSSFPDHPDHLRDLMTSIVQITKDHFPNCRVLYLSSRIYGGYAATGLNPEPYAYESGFAVKWLIEDQLAGDAALNFRPSQGVVEAPWIAWGPYLWADGLTPRSDGLVWQCSDFAPDGVHPGIPARQKVASMLLNFFAHDLTTRRWFVARPADLDNDGVVGFSDLNRVLGSFGLSTAGGSALPGDVDVDGDVDFADLNILLNQYGL